MVTNNGFKSKSQIILLYGSVNVLPVCKLEMKMENAKLLTPIVGQANRGLARRSEISGRFARGKMYIPEGNILFILKFNKCILRKCELLGLV